MGGLDVFLPYAYDYITTFMGKSITTDEWKSHLYAYFEKKGDPEKIKALNSIDWDVRPCVPCLAGVLEADDINYL